MLDADKSSLDDRGLPPDWQFQDNWEITPRDAHAALDAGAPLLLDVRLPHEIETASVDGATVIPLQELPSRLDELDAHRERPIITMCHHGRRSLRAASILRNAGFSDVRSMAGGIDLWAIDIDPSVPRY
ncbi:MAG: rhodanese-like domain-containing protein [Phycisphaerales bacterium]